MTYPNPHTADVPECARCGAGIFAGQDVCDGCAAEDAQARSPFRAPLANAARAVVMREAHAAARARRQREPATPYRACLSAALRDAHARPRRCPLPTLRRQALAWAECAAATDARFDVARKAADALAFSADNDLASLAVPSKLVGTASYQDAAAAVGARLGSRGGWVLTERDGATVYALGLRLGRVQPKHGAWLSALGPVRLAVIAVTGGDPYVTASGDAKRKTRGVNVAVEVGTAALAWATRQECRRCPAGLSAAEMQVTYWRTCSAEPPRAPPPARHGGAGGALERPGLGAGHVHPRAPGDDLGARERVQDAGHVEHVGAGHAGRADRRERVEHVGGRERRGRVRQPVQHVHDGGRERGRSGHARLQGRSRRALARRALPWRWRAEVGVNAPPVADPAPLRGQVHALGKEPEVLRQLVERGQLVVRLHVERHLGLGRLARLPRRRPPP